MVYMGLVPSIVHYSLFGLRGSVVKHLILNYEN